MEYTSTQKFVRMSPTKIRLVVHAIKKMSPVEAIKILPFVGKRSAEPLRKVIKTAVANARQAEVNEGDLVFKEIQIGEGPRLKRGRAGSRGRMKPYVRKMSHIRVTLKVKEKKEIKKGIKNNGTKS